MVLAVDVEPLAARGGRPAGCLGDERGAQPPMPLVRNDNGVKDEGVGPSVPSDIDEANKAVLPSGANPPEAVLVDLAHPVMLGRLVAEAVGVERFQLGVGERTAPLVNYGHPAPG